VWQLGSNVDWGKAIVSMGRGGTLRSSTLKGVKKKVQKQIIVCENYCEINYCVQQAKCLLKFLLL